jgi:alkanesulfonate monooxygenase SsuD/methylene tetrahydromethanopterin reductase-like flavin-dependent oxidoreductase (luciferase family)
MRIGLQVSYFSWPGAPESIGPTFAAIAQDADEAGMASLWVMDHFFQISMIGPPELDMLEGYTALAYAAARTHRIELGTMVTGVTYRHPGILAKTVTTLDVLSGGRAWLGIGAAWNEEEHAGLGVPFPPLAGTLRAARGDAADLPADVDGRRDARTTGTALPARPAAQRAGQSLSRPHPRRSSSGAVGEKKTLRMVAQYADGCNIFDMGPAGVAAEVRRAARALRAAGPGGTARSTRRCSPG